MIIHGDNHGPQLAPGKGLLGDVIKAREERGGEAAALQCHGLGWEAAGGGGEPLGLLRWPACGSVGVVTVSAARLWVEIC